MIQLLEIESRQDARLPEVMDIYQQSFPLREQMPFSWWLRLLAEKEAGEAAERHLAAALRNGEVAGFAYYETAGETGYLWYLATRKDLRGGGIGAEVYREVVERIWGAGCRSLLFEVEEPEGEDLSPKEREFACRRLDWYRRQGARRLGGIEYYQDVGWQPPCRMSLMLHSRDPLTPEAAFQIAHSVLEDAVRAVAPLTLT